MSIAGGVSWEEPLSVLIAISGAWTGLYLFYIVPWKQLQVISFFRSGLHLLRGVERGHGRVLSVAWRDTPLRLAASRSLAP